MVTSVTPRGRTIGEEREDAITDTMRNARQGKRRRNAREQADVHYRPRGDYLHHPEGCRGKNDRGREYCRGDCHREGRYKDRGRDKKAWI